MAAEVFDRHRARYQSCEPGPRPQHSELCHLSYRLCISEHSFMAPAVLYEPSHLIHERKGGG